MNTPTRASVILVLAFLLAVVIHGALTLTGPSWAPTSPFTNNTLNCSWLLSADTIAQNITILRNGATLLSVNETGTPVTLNTSVAVHPDNTTKGDTFICRVILDNGTVTAQSNTSVTILNSPPTTEGYPAGVFLANDSDAGYLVRIAEDTSVVIDVNATDGDNDTLTYLAGDAFCTRNSSATGVYTCSPTQTDLASNTVITLTNVTFTVTDGQNVGGRTITFNVTPINDPPTITTSTQTTPVNQSKNITFGANDTESNYALSFALTAPAEISDKLTLTRLNAAGTSISIYYDATVPDFNDVGSWSVQINVTDNSTNISGGNDSASVVTNFTLNITSVGRKPYFLAITPNGTISAAQGAFIQVNITANDSDRNTTIAFSDDSSHFSISTVKGDNNLTPASGQINFTPGNDDVGLYNATITITDAESLTNTTVLTFNISNVNDAPTVNQLSGNASNSAGASNASALVGYANARFVYAVNATDPDIIYGDNLTYADNTSLFDIGATSGVINFTPTSGQTGVYIVNISVIDSAGLRANRTINLTINPNSAPYFNATVPNLNCTTGSSCLAQLGQYASDGDIGDNISSFSLALNVTLASLSYNSTSGAVNFTPQKTEVAHYLVNLTITDQFGATNSTLFTLRINNTPMAPNLTRYDLTSLTIVEGHPVSYELRATDDDYLVSGGGENVTFSANLSFAHNITALATQNTTARATLDFTPGAGTAGNYTVRINATDAFGLINQRNVSFIVQAAVPPPNITRITPWGANNATHDLQATEINATDAQFLDLIADVNATENTTVRFNVTVNDTRPLTYNWTVDGTQVTSEANYTRVFGFTDSGTYNITLNVSNDRLESARFTWIVGIRDVNRAPILSGNLTSPLTVNGTATYIDYFILGNGTKFLDPDDDLDGSGGLNGGESNTLTFTAVDACGAATLAADDADLVITGTSVGSCSVRFSAIDTQGLSAMSEYVNITILDVPQGSTTAATTTSSGGGGSSSSTFIPIARDKEKPKAFSLIAPKLVTIYDNDSIIIPISIENNWKDPLKFVRISAESNATDVETELSSDLIEILPVNETQEIMLTVRGYRLGENYEVQVTANVSDPDYKDTALILLNSLQQSSDGDAVQVKVTFANDLLSEHPECQELNEVLDQAKQKLQDHQVSEAGKLVDAVINGCKYLVSTQERFQETPGQLKPIFSLDDLSARTLLWSALVFVIIVSVAFVVYYHYTRTPEDDI